MRRLGPVLARLFSRALRHWRDVLLALLAAMTAAGSCWLYLQDSRGAARAGLVVGGTLVGMLAIVAWFGRR